MQNKRLVVIISVVVGLLLVFGCCGMLVLVSLGSSGSRLSFNRIALIHLTGVIAASSDSGVSAADPERLIADLRRADADPLVKVILLRVNSPGGVASASQEIAMELARVKKPVVVSVADIDASGAYMISAEADKIVAPPASNVGSIGVIMEVPDIAKLADKYGVGMTVIKQGKYKDMGNPFRKLTPAEKRILAVSAKVTYDQFVSQVARARKMPLAKVRRLATGQTWTGQEAVKIGLVDQTGNFQDAIDLAARLGRIKGRPNVVDYETPSLINLVSQLANSTAGAAAARATRLDGLADRKPVRF